MKSVRLLIADDHEAVRRGIRSLISSRPDWLICAEAGDGQEAVERVKELRPDIVLMDISMPKMDGVQATRVIRREIPESRVIIVSQNDPAIARVQAAQSGAQEFVTKGTLARDLLPAIVRVIESIDVAAEQDAPSHAHRKEREPSPDGQWLCGGGTLGRLIREFDWSCTPLGAIQCWPGSLRTAVNLMLNSQHPMWIGWGREMPFLYNDAYISVLSLTKHPRSLGRPAREVWAEIWDICGPLAEKVFDKAEPSFVDDVRLFMRRGDYLEETYYSFSYSPLYDESGKVAGLFCPSAETTAKILNARRLQTLSELSAKALLEKSIQAACASSLATIATNPDDIPFSLLYLLNADGSFAKLQGTSVVSGSLADLAPSEIDLGTHATGSSLWPVQEVIATAQSRIIQMGKIDSIPSGPADQPVTEAVALPVTSSGQSRPIGVLIAGVNPTRGLDTEYRTFFKLVSDQVGTAIQNAKASEDEKKRADELAELDRAKTVFFSNVSHEFRTPLTLMLAPLEDTLAQPDGLSSEDRERLQVAHRNSLRLLKLVNTLLDFSRIESGRSDASYEALDLSTLTADLASVFRSAIERAGLQLRINCPPLRDRVYVDREMWEKIVFNLLSNALKFTFSGSIEVSLRETPDSVQLAVSDTGTGIPADELPHLFERFHRVRGARGRTFEGSGIGLALVRELTVLHGGNVEVTSEPERGSTFIVSIPWGDAHLPKERIGRARSLSRTGVQAQAYIHEALEWLPDLPGANVEDPAPPEATKASDPGAKRARIVLADDNADMRKYVGRLLAHRYDVEAVSDGEAALAAVRRQRPEMVLTDVMMPKRDGFGVLKELRSDPNTATIPIILLSARAGEDSRVEGIGTGADDYLVKPFSARELVARVETHLKLAEIRTEAENNVRHREQELRILHEVGATLASELDLQKLVQAATDAGRELSEAGFGAFFYNVVDREDERYMLYTLSGAAPADFSQFPMPRNTCVFAPTFAGQILRADDITKDERYGKSSPYFGMPSGHLPVKSYLAVPVVSRSGEVIGGLFYGHPKAGVFTERAERLVRGVAQQAAIAIDNARLFEAATHARAAAQANAERLRASLTASETGTFRWDIRTNELEWDENLDRLFGVSPNESVRSLEAFLATVHPADRAEVVERCERCVREGAEFEMEFRIVRPDGSTHWLYDRGKIACDDTGRPAYMTGACTEITERKLAEEKAREGHARLKTAMDAGKLGAWDWDVRQNTITWTDRIYEFHGLEAGNFGGTVEAFANLVHPEDRPQVEQALRRALAEQAPYELEFRAVRPSGETRWLFTRAEVMRDATNAPVRMIGITQDVTERKESERILADAARLQRVLFRLADELHRAKSIDEVYNSALDAVFGALQCDRASILLYDDANVMRFVSWRGLSDAYRAATEGHSPWQPEVERPEPVCVTNLAHADFSDALKRTIQAEGIGALAFIPLVSKGKLIGKFMVYFNEPHVFSEAELDSSQTIARQLAFGIERKRAEDTLIQNRDRFDFVGEASELGFWFCDLPLDKLNWDSRVKEHFWLLSDADATIDLFYERIHPDDRDRTRQAIDHAITNHDRYDIEYRTVSPNGQEKWIRAIGRVFRDDAGNPKRFDGVSLDITQKKLAEQALVASEERFRRLAQTLDMEVQVRTRELQERSADVVRQSEMLRELSKHMMQMQDEERRHIARELHDSAGQTLTVLGMRLAQFVQEAQRTTPQLSKEAVEAQELVQQLSREIRTTSYLLHPPLLDETGLASALKWYLDGLKGRSSVDITLDIADDFGRLPRDLELVLFRLVQECLTNIHRHSGSKTATISVNRDAENISLEVRDDGTGISPEKLAQLQSQGSGVGIRGMRERVRQFHGEMNIESSSSGTSVLVAIPAPEDSPSDEEAPLRAVV